MAALRLRWERLSLLTRFTLTGLAVTALIRVALGLYITRQLVELQGGRVWAESPGSGRGSTFYVELAAARPAGAPAGATHPPVQRGAS